MSAREDVSAAMADTAEQLVKLFQEAMLEALIWAIHVQSFRGTTVKFAYAEKSEALQWVIDAGFVRWRRHKGNTALLTAGPVSVSDTLFQWAERATVDYPRLRRAHEIRKRAEYAQIYGATPSPSLLGLALPGRPLDPAGRDFWKDLGVLITGGMATQIAGVAIGLRDGTIGVVGDGTATAQESGAVGHEATVQDVSVSEGRTRRRVARQRVRKPARAG